MLNQVQTNYLTAKALVQEFQDDFDSEEFEKAYEIQLEAQENLIEWATVKLQPLMVGETFSQVRAMLSNFNSLNFINQEKVCDLVCKWNGLV